MRKAFKLLWDLLHVQEQYIKLLGADIDSHASFLHVHGIETEPQVVIEGVRLRGLIKELNEKIQADPLLLVDPLRTTLPPSLSDERLISEIRNVIQDSFSDLPVAGFRDEENIVISVDSEIYHSQKYMELVTHINMTYLWPNKIHNVLFISKG